MSAGIYIIQNEASRKVYIGSSVDIERRWRQHRSALSTGKHGNPHLQASWAKNGPGAFRFWVAEECNAKDLEAREQWWLSTFWSPGIFYNISTDATVPGRGVRRSEESRAAMRRGAIGRTRVPCAVETRRKISAALKGRPISAGAREKIAMALVGHVQSPETRSKRAASNRGRIRTGAALENIRRGNAGKNKGRVLSNEHRAAISAANLGKTRSDETRERLRAAALRREELKRVTR